MKCNIIESVTLKLSIQTGWAYEKIVNLPFYYLTKWQCNQFWEISDNEFVGLKIVWKLIEFENKY